MGTLGYEVWDLGDGRTPAASVAAVPGFEAKSGRSAKWQVIFNNDEAGEQDGRRAQMSISNSPCLTSARHPLLGPVAGQVGRCQAAVDEWSASTGRPSLAVVDPVLLVTEPGTDEQDAHRDWPRELCIDG